MTRPEPGLARGAWEAPAWAFWVALGLVVISTVAYVLRRLGILRVGRDAEPPPSLSPASRRRRP